MFVVIYDNEQLQSHEEGGFHWDIHPGKTGIDHLLSRRPRAYIQVSLSGQNGGPITYLYDILPIFDVAHFATAQAELTRMKTG